MKVTSWLIVKNTCALAIMTLRRYRKGLRNVIRKKYFNFLKFHFVNPQSLGR